MPRRVVVFGLSCALALPALAAEKRPLAELPYTPSLETAFMDPAADPCEDFYQYACGNWIKINPIPPDQSSWSVYGKLYDDNQQYRWGLLEEAAKPDPGRSDATRKIGDYFAACGRTGGRNRGGGPARGGPRGDRGAEVEGRTRGIPGLDAPAPGHRRDDVRLRQ